MTKSWLESEQRAVALVYDIRDCGPRNRFIANGKLVHNSGQDRLNLQNLPRGGALRKSIRAPEGHVLVVSDLSQIEARVIAWLAGQEDLLDFFRSGADPYVEAATQALRRPITKADKRERSVFKAVTLGCGFGMGGWKFAGYLASGPLGMDPILFRVADALVFGVAIDPTIRTDGTTLKLSGEDLLAHCSISQHLVEDYRVRNAKIAAYWKTCRQMLKDMVAGIRRVYGPIETDHDRIRLPNGLHLWYPNLRNEDGKWKYDGRKNETVYIHGAKLAENITQCLAGVLMREQMVRIGERYPVVLTVHDEIVCCVPEEQGEECLAYMTEVMSTPPAWALDLPVACEGSTAKSYGEAK